MFHPKTIAKHTVWLATLLSSAALLNLASAMPANAQTRTNTQYNYAAPLSDISVDDKTAERRTLDWRKSELEFTFDLPAGNFTNKIELLISANPQAGVNVRAPLTVQFNNDEPVMLDVNGQAFDARVTFDPRKARASRNVIRISYNAENGAECILPQDGGWDIDLKASKLAINSRARRRSVQFREIDNHLSTAGLAPRRVGLIATGENATQLQALAAQGIGLRMDNLPNFTTHNQGNDFEVIMARRSELFQYFADDSLVAGRDAAIIIPRGRPVKLVFTGDTDADILSVVKSFAERRLPTTRRSTVRLGEMHLQTPLKTKLVRLSGTRSLVDIPGVSGFSNWTGDDWASGPKSLRFDVTDPSAMSGEVLLRLASSKNISDTSKLSVKLNGKSLGTTLLDRPRKSVAFDIKPGILHGKDNILTLMPDLTPNTVPSCNRPIGPNFHLGGGSKIILNTDTPSAVTELSRMTATAIPFSDEKGAQSYIAMTGSQSDFNASLKVLARLAKTSGEGLTAAQYTRFINLDQAQQSHILVMGPSNYLPSKLVENAPRALKDALRGQAFEGDNLLSANIEKFASLDDMASFKLAAQRLSQSRRIRDGGVAALYPSQSSDAHIVGVITNTPRQDYITSAKTISQNLYWSKIKGGVARWNNETVLSVQAAQNVSGYILPKGENTSAKPRFNFDPSIFDNIFNKTSDVINQTWTGLKALTAKLFDKEASITTEGSNIEAAKDTMKDIRPTLKRAKIGREISSSDTATADTNLASAAHNKLHAANEWAQNVSANIRKSIAEFDLRRSIDTLQMRVRPLGQSIRTLFKPSQVPYASQSLAQRLLSPAALILFFAFILALIGLLSSSASSRKDR